MLNILLLETKLLKFYVPLSVIKSCCKIFKSFLKIFNNEKQFNGINYFEVIP